MGRYILHRLFYSIFVLAGLTVMVFTITHLIGDPARLMLPLEASEEQYRSLRQALGLDLPLHIQFARFALQVMRGDLGVSIWQGVPALPLVLSRFPATMYLALCTVAFLLLITLPLGILSAIRSGSLVDRITMLFSFAGVSTPTFWLALMLILILVVRLGWFKTPGYGGPKYLALPMLSLSAYTIGRLAQMVRVAMLEEVCYISSPVPGSWITPPAQTASSTAMHVSAYGRMRRPTRC